MARPADWSPVSPQLAPSSRAREKRLAGGLRLEPNDKKNDPPRAQTH